jgi:hypothetical protein
MFDIRTWAGVEDATRKSAAGIPYFKLSDYQIEAGRQCAVSETGAPGKHRPSWTGNVVRVASAFVQVPFGLHSAFVHLQVLEAQSSFGSVRLNSGVKMKEIKITGLSGASRIVGRLRKGSGFWKSRGYRLKSFKNFFLGEMDGRKKAQKSQKFLTTDGHRWTRIGNGIGASRQQRPTGVGVWPALVSLSQLKSG